MNTSTSMPSLMPSSRGSDSTTAMRAFLARVGVSLWRALSASGEFRARQHMLNFADGCEALQPALAAEVRAASARIGAR